MPTATSSDEFASRSIFVRDLITEQFAGNILYVNGNTLTASRNGKSFSTGFATLTAALAAAVSGDRILIAPIVTSGTTRGTYNEAVVIPFGLNEITILGTGPRYAVAFAPTAVAPTTLTVNSDDVRIVNCDFITNGAGTAARINGSRVKTELCRFKGDSTTGSFGIVVGPVLVAALGVSGGAGTDYLSQEDEVSFLDKGIVLQGNDTTAVKEPRFARTRINNVVTAHFTEGHLAGGAAANHFRGLEVREVIHDNLEAGTAPTKYYDLNASNSNTGQVVNIVIPAVLASGLALVSTACKWTGNFHTAGLSTTQPS